MSKEALHALIDRVYDDEVIDHVYYLLSRIVEESEEVELLPEELEAIKEAEEDKAKGVKFATHEEVWGAKAPTKVA